MPVGIYKRKPFTEEHKKNMSESGKGRPEDVWNKIIQTFPSLCWEWVGSKTSGGYGQIGINNKIYGAHRVAYEETNGKIPEGVCVLHHCDNRSCCNPNHLWPGTQKDNVKDMKEKGRGNYIRILSNKDVIKLRSLHSTGKYYQRELGEMFGVSQGYIANIINNKTRNHIPMEE